MNSVVLLCFFSCFVVGTILFGFRFLSEHFRMLVLCRSIIVPHNAQLAHAGPCLLDFKMMCHNASIQRT